MPEQTSVQRPILSGGISTLAPHMRSATQVADANNVTFSVQRGVTSRPGTKFVVEVGDVRLWIAGGLGGGTISVGDIISQGGGTITATVISQQNDGTNYFITARVTLGTFSNGNTTGTGYTARATTVISQWTTGAKLRLYPFTIGKGEKYLAVISAGGIPKVYDTTGNEAMNFWDHLALTYMAANSATADDYRFAAAEFFVFVANSTEILRTVNGGGTAANKDLTETPDSAHMPYVLKRTSTAPLKFILDNVTWTARGSRGTGDYVAGAGLGTNPIPNVFKNSGDNIYRITDIAMFRDRLGLFCGTRSILSQIKKFYDFWLQSPGTALDSDPIEFTLPGKDIHSIDRVVEGHKTVVAFTISGKQFEFSTADILAPGSGAWTESTSYRKVNGVPPAILGNKIVFPSPLRNNCAMYHYEFGTANVPSDAENVAGHYDQIPVDVVRVVTSTNDGITIALCDTTANILYWHREYFNGGERLQSAWSKWTFEAGTKINDIAIIDNNLYLLNESATGAQWSIDVMAIDSLYNNPDTFVDALADSAP